MGRNSFIFYESWWNAIKSLPKDEQCDVITAIIEYGLSGGITGELKPIPKAILTMAMPQIDANNLKYKNGKMGGRPCKERESKPNEKDNIPNGMTKIGELSSSSDGFDYSGLMKNFNENLGDMIPRIKAMTDNRRKAVRSRIREHGVDSVKLVFDSVKRSSFLTGRGDSDWKATFDWIFSPRNYVKIMEGNYDDKEQCNERTAIYTIPG